jgi:type IV secretion system protein TrbL
VITTAMTASTLLGKLLTAFLTVLSAGMVRTIPEMLVLLRILATIELTLAATAWHNAHAALFERFFWKLMGIIVLMMFVDAWKWWIDHARDGFIQAGLFVGDNAISVADFTDPGNIIDFGFSVTALVFQYVKSLSWWSESSQILYSGLAALMTVLFYIVMAAAVFQAVLEYYIVCAAGLFLVPFLVFEKTAFIGERVFPTIVAHAVRLMLLALLLNIALPVLYQYKLPAQPQFQEVMLLCGVSFVLMVLALGAGSLASGFLHGTPSMGWHSVLHGATSFAQTTAAMGAVGYGMGIAGARVHESGVRLGAALEAAAEGGQAAYRAVHPTTHASRRGQLATQILGSAQGIGRYSMDRLTRNFRQSVADGRTRARTARTP